MLTYPTPANLGSTTKTNKTETNKDKSEAKEGSFQSIKLKSSFNLSQTGEYNKLSLALTPIIVTGVMVFSSISPDYKTSQGQVRNAKFRDQNCFYCTYTRVVKSFRVVFVTPKQSTGFSDKAVVNPIVPKILA